MIAKGKPEDIFPNLISHFNITLFTFEKENVEPYGLNRDQQVLNIFKKLNDKIEIKTFSTHTLFDPELLLAKNDGVYPKTYTGFVNIVSKLQPLKPIETFKDF